MESKRFSNRQQAPERRAGFTLVELLVVITIIGILVSLIAAASIRAWSTARQASIKFEVDQIAAGFEKYKDSANSYPPNLQTDDSDFTTAAEPAATPISESGVLSDLQRHMRQAFPKHNEPNELLQKLVGNSGGLVGGMNAAEAVVFWLGGFSADPQYPISGEGGPSYVGTVQQDPIESRKWIHEFDVGRLGPRDDQGFFAGRSITYTVNGQTRQLNFWTYNPGRSTKPVVYFDVSRHPATAAYDPTAAADLHLHAFKVRKQSSTTAVDFANQGKFQLIHAGIDDDWGEPLWEQMSLHDVALADLLLFPNGPFTDAMADTVVNFAQQARIEDAQPQ
jgi:prepilin-type N-terminal cleavage/methylation domain-containing protein